MNPLVAHERVIYVVRAIRIALDNGYEAFEEGLIENPVEQNDHNSNSHHHLVNVVIP